MFQLMLKDNVCATFELDTNRIETKINNIHVLGRMPIGCSADNLLKWLDGRHASKHREHLQAYLYRMGVNNTEGFLRMTHGISINDCFWVREETESVRWKDVSPYTNDYDEIIQHLAFNGKGLFGERMSSTSPEFGTSGAFDKCWVKEDSGIHLIKRGSDIASNSGLEPYCEVLASQLFNAMCAGIPYKLVKYHGIVSSKCKLFNNEDYSFIPYAALNKDSSFTSLLDWYDNLGSDMFRRILVCDALTLNTDRHTGNHGVICDSMSQEVLHSAPGFDYNLSMCPYLTSDDFAQFDVKFYGAINNTRVGNDSIAVAREVLTPAIRRDLINLKGIKLSLPWVDDRFTQERVDWMTTIVNTQIDNILSDKEPVVPEIKVSEISNCMRYRMKYNLTEEQWLQDVPRLMQLFRISHMAELEVEIKRLL